MRLKFALQSGDSLVDLVAASDASATVGDLATHLSRANPARSGALTGDHEMTLALVDRDRQTLDPRTTLAESGLFSGDTVTLVRAGGAFVEAGRAVAVVVITAGPDAGREIPLPRGTAYIGRGRGCEVALADGSVSRRHAKLVLTDVAEVVDLGSANGITAEGQQVTRAQLRSGDVIHLGDTELEVHLLDTAGASETPGVGVIGTDGGVVSYSRSPRLAPIYPGRPFEVPELPERPRPQPFPVISLLIPIIMAVVLYVATKNILSLLFLAMMPMMIAGQTFESRRQAKKEFAQAMADFREDLALLVTEIDAEHGRERLGRLGEHPSGIEALTAMDARNELLWTRRPADPGFLELRFGIGARPSRCPVELPKVGRSRAEAWLEVSRRMAGVEMLDGVPVVAEPLVSGAIGVCGPREGALGAARSLVIQAAGLHSPAEVVVVAFASTRTALDWDFLKWLPHTASPHSPLTARPTASTAPACAALADELEDLVLGLGQGDEGRSGPCVLVVVEGDAPIDRSRLVALAERGHRSGVVLLWVAERQALLPASCRTFLVAGGSSPTGEAHVGYVHEGLAVAPVYVDAVSAAEAMLAARRLAPVVDAGVAVDDASDLPRAVSLVALTGTELMSSSTAQIERWKESRSILTGPFAPAVLSRKPGNLRAVIGQSSQGTLTVDLRADGPHALVGGTTGAGKSELLQAWILGMAAAHSPQRVTFLLVDYKGGSAFRDCVRLPHTVGLVTDLSPHLVRRALESLSAELRFREHLLARHKAKDLVELERRGEVDAPPSLIIVVDEFAALVGEVPEFVDGVVNVAQRGRSLGLHLILATQRPAGVIKDNLRANTNLRLALRM
ncbi:MAG: FtsK/SpoIIIE domain-containing protein, partial [Lapillicoccus sp.]